VLSAVQLAAVPHSGQARADAATGSAGLFVPATGRLLDTRNGTGGFSTPMPAGGVRTVTATGRAGIPASGVSAVALTLTAIGAASIGAISVAPGDVATPPGAALVFNPGDSISNTALVALHADGTLHVLADHAVNLIIDVQGYFTAGSTPAPGGFVAVDQARLTDTRSGSGVPASKVGTGGAVTVQAGGMVGVPADASAVYANITVLNQTANGYLRTYAADQPVPTTGARDFDDSATAQSVAIPLSADGQFTVLVGAGGPVDLVVDIQGYFSAATSSGTFTPAAVRLLDTRAAPVRTLAGNSVTKLSVAGVAGIPAVAGGLAAVVLNLRTVQPATGSASGYLRLWPSDQPEPATSSVNYTTANIYRTDLAIVAPAADGTINVRNGGPGAVDLVIDVEGWFGDSGPGTPFVSSTAYEEGAWTAASVGAGAFQLQPADGPTPAVYRYALDGAAVATVLGPSAQLLLAPQGTGQHVLTVSAIDAAGATSAAYDYTFYIGSAPTSPAAVTVVATTAVAAITWTASLDNGAPVTSYHLTLRDETTSTVHDEGSCATCSQYVITALDPTHIYTASVAADSDAGQGPFQSSAPFTPNTGTPGDCPDDSGCVIQPVTTPVATAMDDPSGDAAPQQLAANPDDYYTVTTEEISDDPDSVHTNAVWSGYYLPNGYKRSDGHTYDTVKLAHTLSRCHPSGCVPIGQVILWVHEYINGGTSIMWDDQVHTQYVYGPRYYVEAEYQCARNISGADRFCNTYSDKADGYDSEVLTTVGTGNHQYDWWHHFGTARSVTKYQLLRLLVKWPDQNEVCCDSNGGNGTKLRMYDVRRDSTGWSKLANTSGTGW
jgi:hypothetical protein